MTPAPPPRPSSSAASQTLASASRTDAANRLPALAGSIPRSLRALAMVRSEVAPLACSSVITGARATRLAAASALASAPSWCAFAVSFAAARKPPRFLPRRAQRTATATAGRGETAFSDPAWRRDCRARRNRSSQWCPATPAARWKYLRSRRRPTQGRGRRLKGRPGRHFQRTVPPACRQAQSRNSGHPQ